MKRLYIFIFLVGLLGNNIMYAQIPASSQSLPSPNVAALGLYGASWQSHPIFYKLRHHLMSQHRQADAHRKI